MFPLVYSANRLPGLARLLPRQMVREEQKIRTLKLQGLKVQMFLSCWVLITGSFARSESVQ